jgi:hypothetical protein
MKDVVARIERVALINQYYQRLDLAVTDPSILKVKPGQSFLARRIDSAGELTQSWHPYLRERWWAYATSDETLLSVEVPRSNAYHRKDTFSLLGPVGQPYLYATSLRSVLLLAYHTDPVPLSVMIPSLVRNNINTTLVLLGDARRYETKSLPPEVEVIHGDRELNWEGALVSLSHAQQIFAVVSPDDELLRFSEVLEALRRHRDSSFDLGARMVFGILQSALPCGVGACDACLVKTKDGTFKRACLAGPAFDLTTLKL